MLPIFMTKNANNFKNIFCTLADDLFASFLSIFFENWLTISLTILGKILKLPNSKFKFNFGSEGIVLKLFNNLNENKTAVSDNLSGKFFKRRSNCFS